MKQFAVFPLVLVITSLDQVMRNFEQVGPVETAKIIAPQLRENMARTMEGFLVVIDGADLEMTSLAANRMIGRLRDMGQDMSTAEIVAAFAEVQHRCYDELDTKGKFFRVPLNRATYFEKPDLFGDLVLKRFPKLTEDIAEAGNTFAAGRYTACVFHLMRIMEVGVQRLGKKLGVPNVNNLVWQVLLDQINAAIKTLPQKSPSTKKFAAVAGHLYNVKLAWRNEVMHPKSTYTETEAENLLGQVNVFMSDLAALL
jgi:hypothetical protein